MLFPEHLSLEKKINSVLYFLGVIFFLIMSCIHFFADIRPANYENLNLSSGLIFMMVLLLPRGKDAKEKYLLTLLATLMTVAVICVDFILGIDFQGWTFIRVTAIIIYWLAFLVYVVLGMEPGKDTKTD